MLTGLYNKQGETILSSYVYTYMLDGNQERKIDNTGKVTTYTYDGLGRLTGESVTGSSAVTYEYDDSNNRSKMIVQGVSVTAYIYDRNNRLIAEAVNVSMVYMG